MDNVCHASSSIFAVYVCGQLYVELGCVQLDLNDVYVVGGQGRTPLYKISGSSPTAPYGGHHYGVTCVVMYCVCMLVHSYVYRGSLFIISGLCEHGEWTNCCIPIDSGCLYGSTIW